MSGRSGSTLSRALRLLLATLGGYGFAAGSVALLAASLPHLGMARSESAMLGGLLGLLIYLGIIIWLVATPHLLRTSIMVAGAAWLMIVLAPWLVVA